MIVKRRTRGNCRISTHSNDGIQDHPQFCIRGTLFYQENGVIRPIKWRGKNNKKDEEERDRKSRRRRRLRLRGWTLECESWPAGVKAWNSNQAKRLVPAAIGVSCWLLCIQGYLS